MNKKIVLCPVCGKENEVFGNGFYGSYQCQHCTKSSVWFNLWGQQVCSPEEQMQCEDW